jgi:hypothetical protein
MYSLDSMPFGKSWGEWTARWWQWMLSIPKGNNPVDDNIGQKSAESQSGPVWFLTGTNGGQADRECTIPAGKAILGACINDSLTFLESQNINTQFNTVEDLRTSVKNEIDSVATDELLLTIDGTTIRDLEKFRVKSPEFSVTLPVNNIYDVEPGPTQGVSDGYWFFLEPLPVGKHQMHFRGKSQHFSNEVKYSLNVK